MSDINQTVLTMLQVSLSEFKEQSGQPLTSEIILERIEELALIPRFSGINKALMLEKLESLFTVWTDKVGVISDDDDHVPWLHMHKSEISWRFWNRYKLYLAKEAGLGPAGIENIDSVSDEVLSNLEFPGTPGPWDRRGLVMGNVQSGKTGTYAGLICKAADSGYKVIVVLTGLHNSLRSQTQIRLDEGFLGYKASATKQGGFVPTGVWQYDKTLRADSVTNRQESGDFSRTLAKQFGIQPGGNPLLFVVKKNATILKNLLTWIHSLASHEDPNTGRRFHKDVPLLLIDDEADQASVNINVGAVDEFGRPDEDHDPTKINKLIRQLLFAFDKSAYVAFTATPFANIFIHDQAKGKEIGPDLFPRSFIVNLPAPSNYFGAAKIFGIEEDESLGIEAVEPVPISRIVRDYADTASPNETRGWMPPKLINKTDHAPLYGGKREIPPSLREAILAFILSTSVRQIREGDGLFNSMLVHVTRFTKIQSEVKSQVEIALKEILHRLTYGDGASEDKIIDRFHDLWCNDFIETSAEIGSKYTLPAWEEVSQKLLKTAASIVVKEINGSAGDVLDYEKYSKTGLNVIAVGGDKLSRGLTLEGLTVSYYLRSSRMYDTLMQMGRWFGYKEKYIDLCRLYTTSDLYDFFMHVAVASEELKAEFDYMKRIGGTPKEYGLKVRSHPVLLVTSQLKMRSGTEMQLSYSGDISETLIYPKDHKKISNNLSATNLLIRSMGGEKSAANKGGSYIWKDVPGRKIIEFLTSYDTHKDARKVDGKLIAKYIEKQIEQNELTNWTVYLLSVGVKSDGKANDVSKYFSGMKVGANIRKNIEQTKISDRYTIKRLIGPAHEFIDLNPVEYERALELSVQNWKDSSKKNKSTIPPTSPSGRSVREIRSKEKGLLLLYPLYDEEVSSSGGEMPNMGFAISFPKSETAKSISYIVTNIFAGSGDLGDI